MKSLSTQGLVLERPSGFTLGPLTLELLEGSRTALIGPSGCGKTTLLRCLAGLEALASGRIKFGDSVVTEGRKILVGPSQRHVGFVFQDGALWPHMTALDHLRFVSPGLGRKEAEELLAQVELPGLGLRRPAELSGGEGQRLALARALAGNPEILLLDEPLQSVDVNLRDSLGLLIRHIAEARGLTLVVVTHESEEALVVAEQILVMKEGRILEHGDASELLQRPQTAFGAAFLGQATCLPATDNGHSCVQTVFGTMPRPAQSSGALALVILPGDVRSTSAEGEAHPLARVLRVELGVAEHQATVELDGRSLKVPCSAEVEVGHLLRLELLGEPRLLPWDR